ncbi:MAG: PSD1 and planctomycete cytochrome C domain-containing protein [Pseudomonadota bacterium]
MAFFHDMVFRCITNFRLSVLSIKRFVGVLGLLSSVSCSDAEQSSSSVLVSFNEDVRPILNQYCVSCHGGVRQKAGVSFIYREQALGKGESGNPTIVPGNPEASELIVRLKTDDLEERMPYHAPPLSTEQIAVLEEWVKQGAKWEAHWAFEPPKRANLDGDDTEEKSISAEGAIDRYIADKLTAADLMPAEEASKSTLLRRLSLDLTGLAPTVEELDAFQSDVSATAYEKQVDRLLSSPRFGERWASMWLDVARYADSKGYLDRGRDSWPYRDWVISAFNDNVPYDSFVTKQLAGDLLPEPTMGNLIATSFLRQSRNNDEAGADDEQFRMEAAMERNAMVWSTLNGLTMNCVQCHSHPYDPIQHEEYYKSLAFFNNTEDHDLPSDEPFLPVSIDENQRYETFSDYLEYRALRRDIVNEGRAFADAVQSWNDTTALSATATGFEGVSLYAGDEENGYGDLPEFEIDNAEIKATAPSSTSWIFDYDVEVPAEPLSAIRFEVIPLDEDKAAHSPERGFAVDAIEAYFVSADGEESSPLEFHYFIPDAEENISPLFGPNDVLSADLSRNPGAAKLNYSPARYRAQGGFGSVPKLYKRRWTIGILKTPIEAPKAGHLRIRFKFDSGINEMAGTVRRLRIQTSASEKWQTFDETGSIAEKYVQMREAHAKLAGVPSATLPIINDLPQPLQRATHKFERGNMMTKVGDALQPSPPSIFPEFDASGNADRLSLAQWFFEPEQPLTSRVAVNRIWGQLFGTGIVRSQEDFGGVGEEPTNQELLDWLAREFQDELKWDVKALIRMIVLSDAYRRSSKATDRMLEVDPDNRLLSRGPRQRLTAEMVRDQALYSSGLLTEEMGGVPVAPPSEDRGGQEQAYKTNWLPAEGDNRYRRSIYTGIKRTTTYPSLLIFDMKARDMSAARRHVTNTPSQALVTLNEPIHVEAAKALGQRMCSEADESDLSHLPEGTPESINAEFARCIVRGARIVLSRPPTAHEVSTFYDLFEGLSSDDIGNKTVGGTNKEPVNEHRWSLVASAMLNLDAALTR